MTHQVKSDNNGKRWVFSEATYEKINLTLAELCKRLKAQLALFADMNGYPVSYGGDVKGLNINNLTALAAGTFSATAEIAHIIKEENNFKYIFHEGEKRNIYLCTVGHDYLMIVVFNKSTALGMVRALTHHAVERLSGLVEELKQESQHASQFLDVEFKSLLGKELDKSFGL